MHRILRWRSKNTQKPELRAHFLRGVPAQDRGAETHVLSDMQDCSPKAFQGKESSEKLYRTRLRSQIVGTSQEKQLLFNPL